MNVYDFWLKHMPHNPKKYYNHEEMEKDVLDNLMSGDLDVGATSITDDQQTPFHIV